MKKIFIFLIILFAGIVSVSAKNVCEYEQYTGRTIEISFDASSFMVKENGVQKDYEVKFELETDKACPNTIYTALSNGDIYDKQNSVNSLRELKLVKSYYGYVSCGTGVGAVTEIPRKIPELTSTIFTIIQVAVPVILVLIGSIDLFKGLTSSKEDEIKKGQQILVKRLIVAVIIFVSVVVVKFLISVVADTNSDNISQCIDCFISNNCKEVK